MTASSTHLKFSFEEFLAWLWFPQVHYCVLFSQLIICGLGKIDVNDWKVNTRLKHCTPDSNIVKWFWKAVEFFDEERRARLLQFVTGSSRVPLQGFKALQGNSLRCRQAGQRVGAGLSAWGLWRYFVNHVLRDSLFHFLSVTLTL